MATKISDPEEEDGYIIGIQSTYQFILRTAILEDTSLSIEARLALSWMLSRPIGWKIWVRSIRNLGMGRDRARKALKQLEDKLYLKRERLFNKETGHFYWTWDPRPEPCPEFQAMAENTPNSPCPEIQAMYLDTASATNLDTTYLSCDEASPALLSEVEEKIAIEDVPAEVPANGKHTNGKKERVSPPSDGNPTLHQQFISTLCEVMKLDIRLNAAKVAKTAKSLRLSGYTPEQLQLWYGPGGWWYTSYWKGKRGEPPDIKNINETVMMAHQGFVAENGVEEVDQALGILKQVIRDVGRYGSPDVLGPKTRAAVAKMGGWNDVCNMLEKDLPYRFKGVYGK